MAQEGHLTYVRMYVKMEDFDIKNEELNPPCEQIIYELTETVKLKCDSWPHAKEKMIATFKIFKKPAVKNVFSYTQDRIYNKLMRLTLLKSTLQLLPKGPILSNFLKL